MGSFETEFGSSKVGFLIRKFEERADRNQLVSIVRDTFRQRGFIIVDASEKTLHPEAWSNVKEFLNHCTFGVVIVDNLSPYTPGFNPNVFLEIGYLLALKKPIFILIQNSLASTLPTDVKPFIYTSFDSQDIFGSESLCKEITKWIDNTVDYNPGYLSMFLKGEIIDIDAIRELKNLALSISSCAIVENGRLARADIEEVKELGITVSSPISKLWFKTQTKEMAARLVSHLENGTYKNVPHSKSILKAKLEPASITGEYVQGGIHYLFNNDEEALIYCQNEGIQDCKTEECYAASHFSIKKTNKINEIEIVIVPKFQNKHHFLYVSNFIHDERRYTVKMCHYPKTETRIVLPFSVVDILFLVVCGYKPPHEKLSINSDFRKLYLDIIDLHIDKAKFFIENTVPTEIGFAKNVQYFNIPSQYKR